MQAVIRMKGCIYTIPHPRRLLEILVHSGGYKKRTVFLCCRATLTHSRAPAANFIRCMCHPRCAARGGFFFIHLVKCFGVIMSSSVKMQSLCCKNLPKKTKPQLYSHPQASPNHSPREQISDTFFFFFFVNFNIT